MKNKNSHYLIHLPHCGTQIPAEYLDDYLLSKDELNYNIFQYADLYTDELFTSLYDKYDGVKSPYSRLFIDPERFGDDKLETMYQKFKLGWFYENSILDKKPLRGVENKSKIRKYFDEHHAKLNQLTQDKIDKYDKCTVIDCHSFSNERYWFHDKNLHLPDICIGFEDNHVDDKLVEKIKDAIPSGMCAINEVVKQSANYHAPFGGVGASGMGAYYGKTGFDFFSHNRPTLVNNNFSTLKYDPSVWLAMIG